MLRTRQGDEQAFEQLVTAYQDRLIGIFYHMISDRSAAEDLAQDVFLRVYRARETYTPSAKFSTWLFRIANNAASNQRRNRGRRRERSLNLQQSSPHNSQPVEKLLEEKSKLMPSRQAASREACDQVREALNSLGNRQRMAILLHRFEGMSYVDIGDTMNMTAAAVKSLLSRARDSLRTKLESYVNRQ
ncbi:MAG: sigma-70 family RNA polymerase sigma factor [Planctomycetaceae bacterium]